MTDFLTRLAGRTTGMVRAVQPVSVPMYASTPDFIGNRSDDFMLHEEEISSDHRIQQNSVLGRTRMTQKNAPSHKTPADLSREMAATGSPSLQPLIPQVAQEHQPAITPRPSSPSQNMMGESEKPALTDTHIESEKPAFPAGHSTTVPGGVARAFGDADAAIHQFGDANTMISEAQPLVSSVQEVGTMQQRNPLSPRAPFPIEHAIPLTVVPTHSALEAREDKTVVPQTASYQRRETDTPRREYTLEAQEAQPPRQEAPTIQVSIGRIEVRATAPEPRPQPQRSEPRITGLDEYLSQRAKGGGR